MAELTMKQRQMAALSRTWNEIAQDSLDCMEAKSLPRAHVIDATLDASYAENYGGDAEAIAELRKLSYEEQEAIAKLAFPYARYS